jgi:hypothetical protein
LISKNSSNGGGWKIFSKENVGNVSYVLDENFDRNKTEDMSGPVAPASVID